jgi:hypothetical protein
MLGVTGNLKDDAYDMLDGLQYGEKSLDEAMKFFSPHLTYAENIATQPVGTDGAKAATEASVHQENATAIEAETQAQENLNKVENQNPPSPNEASVHNANAEAINEEAAAQAKLNQVKQGQSYSGTVYHGSKTPLDDVTYDPTKGQGQRNVGNGLYFTPNLEQAAKHGKNILQSNVQLDNVFTFTEEFITDINALYQAMGKIKPANVDWETIKRDLHSTMQLPGKAQEFTQNMLKMGYQGMYSKGYGYADPSVEQLVVYDEQYHQNLTTRPYSEIINSANAAKQAIDGVTGAQERLNNTEAQNPPAQDDSGVHNTNADAINKEVQSQEQLAAKIKETQALIKNQQAWLNTLDPYLNDANYQTSGKKAATEQLRDATQRLVNYRRNPEEYAYESMAEQKRVVDWNKAYQEAQRQGVADSTLLKYDTDAKYQYYEEALKALQKERDYRAQVLKEAQAELQVLQQQANTQEQINATKTQEPKPAENTAQIQNETVATTQQIQSYE